jgi:hypothetical protein
MAESTSNIDALGGAPARRTATAAARTATAQPIAPIVLARSAERKSSHSVWIARATATRSLSGAVLACRTSTPTAMPMIASPAP